MESTIWDTKVLERATASSSRKFVTSSNTNSKPLPSRADKVRYFQYLDQMAEEYFQSRNEPSVVPINFSSTHIDQMVDVHSQKALLITIDLMLIVMLNCEESADFIGKIMGLSEDAQDEIQQLIMRSKSNLDDLISSQ
jgi:hypothetical protein